MAYDVQNLSSGASAPADDLEQIRAVLERIMSDDQRWQVLSRPQPGAVQIEASGVWPDMSSLEDFDE